jgi:hypothetical protein
MAFLFYIDGQLTDQPVNDTELFTSIKRESTLDVILINQDIKVSYASNSNLDIGTISGYSYLRTLYNDSICNEAEIKIFNQATPVSTVLIYTGVIKVPSLIFDEQRFTVSASITDNNFYSYINNNKSVEVNFLSTLTKSKKAIEPPPIYKCNMFSSCGFVYGAAIGAYFYGYRISDLLRYIIAFITDNKVGFYSKYLEDPNNGIHLFLFEGINLANANTQPDFTQTFEKLYREIFKLKNVSFYIETADPDNPVLRLEDAEYFYNQTTVYTFDDIKNMSISSAVDKLYGTIKVGSEVLSDGANSANTFSENLSYFGWKKESFTPFGQCNVGAELDLVNNYVISNNAINNQLVGAVTENLDEFFIVEMGSIDETLHEATAKAYLTSYPSSCPITSRFYNIGLNNVNKLQRHGTNYLNAISNSQSIGGDGFRAELGTEELLATTNASPSITFPMYTYYFDIATGVSLKPIIFVNEFNGSNYDGNGNYNNTNGMYTVPSDGVYSFSSLMTIEVTGAGQQCATNVHVLPPLTLGVSTNGVGETDLHDCLVTTGVGFKLIIAAYEDSTLATLIDFQEVNAATLQDNTYQIGCSFASPLVAGNVVICVAVSFKTRTITGNNSNGTVTNTWDGSTPYLNSIMPLEWYANNCGGLNAIEMYAKENSYFECNGTPDQGAVLASGSADKFTINMFDFEYHIPDDDWEFIKGTPIGLFNFTKDEITRTGYIQSIERNNQTGLAKIKLITPINATISN